MSRSDPPIISSFLWRWFSWYGQRFVGKHFHALRLSGPLPEAVPHNVPLIIYLNHPSWWDPMACLCVANYLWPTRQHYAPIDAKMLDKYRFFRKLGFFPVDQTSPRGGTQFLRTARAILAQPNSTLWITAQGEFADVRSRPIQLRPGLSHLLKRLDAFAVLPLAIEYAFWNERDPEMLIRFGSPITSTVDNQTLEQSLTKTMDALAIDSLARAPERFQTLLGGSTGTAAVYDFWRSIQAKVTGKTFSRAHGKANQ